MATLIGGSLLILISFTTNFTDADIQQFASLPILEQIGLSLHAAALAALVGDVELATRLRDRARNRDAAREQREVERTQLQTQCLVAQFRFLLSDTPRNRLQLSEVLALLLEEIRTNGLFKPPAD